MRYEHWQRYYDVILAEFGFDRAADEQAALLLSELLKGKHVISVQELAALLEDRAVYVIGAAIASVPDVFEGVVVAADGATSALVEHDIIPDIIVTDLDGKLDDQLLANEAGAIVLIHAHGDNIERLKKWVPRFKGRVLGTTQSRPFNGIHNFGGFTDGDRAVFLAAELNAKKIMLCGFEFASIGKYSFYTDKNIKLAKLKWAERLIDELNAPIAFL